MQHANLQCIVGLKSSLTGNITCGDIAENFAGKGVACLFLNMLPVTLVAEEGLQSWGLIRSVQCISVSCTRK